MSKETISTITAPDGTTFNVKCYTVQTKEHGLLYKIRLYAPNSVDAYVADTDSKSEITAWFERK